MRRVPAEPVLIGYRIVRIRHEKDVRWQLCLLGQEFLRVLVEIGRRPRVDKKDPGFFALNSEAWSMKSCTCRTQYGALITGKSPQDNENKVVSPLYP